MSRTQFTVLAGLLVILIVIVIIRSQWGGKQDEPPLEPPKEAGVPPDICSVCGRDLVEAHGKVLIRNTTMYHARILVRHHPDAEPKVLSLDPDGCEVVPGILVGTMMVRATGEGFDEQSHCTILANTRRIMNWTVRGWEVEGMPSMHMGG